MKPGDVVSITEQRGVETHCYYVPLGLGIVLDVKKTEDITFGSVGPFNLGDDVTVHLATGETKTFLKRSLEVICESYSN